MPKRDVGIKEDTRKPKRAPGEASRVALDVFAGGAQAGTVEALQRAADAETERWLHDQGKPVPLRARPGKEHGNTPQLELASEAVRLNTDCPRARRLRRRENAELANPGRAIARVIAEVERT